MDLPSFQRRSGTGIGGGSFANLVQWATLLEEVRGGDVVYNGSGSEIGTFKISSNGIYAVSVSLGINSAATTNRYAAIHASAPGIAVHNTEAQANTLRARAKGNPTVFDDLIFAPSWAGWLQEGSKVWVLTNVGSLTGALITVTRVG